MTYHARKHNSFKNNIFSSKFSFSLFNTIELRLLRSRPLFISNVGSNFVSHSEANVMSNPGKWKDKTVQHWLTLWISRLSPAAEKNLLGYILKIFLPGFSKTNAVNLPGMATANGKYNTCTRKKTSVVFTFWLLQIIKIIIITSLFSLSAQVLWMKDVSCS